MTTRRAAIIGSGVGGLTAAILLAREGWSVHLLEQHDRPGGLMSTFRRGGLSFPTGVHCLGALAKGQILRRYLDYLGVADRLALHPMDPDGFVELRWPGRLVSIPCGREAFVAQLGETFGDVAAVRRFVADMAEAVQTFPLYNLDFRAERPAAYLQQTSLADYLRGLTQNAELRSALAGPWPLHGLRPEECPLYVHFLVMDSFIQSAYRIDEQATPLAETFVQCFREAGGVLHCGCRVEGIDCRGGRARGVRIQGGDELPADVVVYTGHPKSLPGLCTAGRLRPAYAQRLQHAPETVGVFGALLSWRGENCPLSRRDVLLQRDRQIASETAGPVFTGSTEPAEIWCCGAPESQGGSYAAVAMCLLSLEETRPWMGTRRGKRPASYRKGKRALSERLAETVRSHWPASADDIDVLDAFTPLTMQDYTLSPTGSCYGVKRAVGAVRTTRISAATRVKGLYLAGQNVILSGVLGTVISGIEACGAVLGKEQLVRRIAKETA